MTDAGLDVVERIERLESRAAIGDLVANYCHGFDQHELELFASVFHPDAGYLAGEAFGNYHGLEEIRRAATDVIWPAMPRTAHSTTNLVVEIAGDRATGRSSVVGEADDPDGNTAAFTANYEDIYERRNGTWKIAERRVVIRTFVGLSEEARQKLVDA